MHLPLLRLKKAAFSAAVLSIGCLVTFSIHCNDNPVQLLEDTQNQTARVDRPSPSIGGHKVYFGHLHNHHSITGDNSHAMGTLSEAYNYAKNTAHLDFFGLCDHDLYVSDEVWGQMKAAANTYNNDSNFVAFCGFEWSTVTMGHIAIINSNDHCVSTQAGVNTVAGIFSWIANRPECIAFFNHPGRQETSEHLEFGHFTLPVVNNIVGIELWNKSDPFSEYYYNDGYFTNDNNSGYFDETLQRGWKVGASGSDDNHTGTWGTDNDNRVAVLADTLTRAAILSAMRAKRFYSTLDKSLLLSFKINGFDMGSTIQGAPASLINIAAADVELETFTEVVLFNQRHEIERIWTLSSSSVQLTHTLNTYAGQYYYVKVKQQDGNEAISSPIWIVGGSTNTPPAAVIVSPADSTVLNAPVAYCRISARAWDPDPASVIRKVTLYADNTLIGEMTLAAGEIYSANWNNPAVGTHTVYVKVTDDAGATTASAPINIKVNPESAAIRIDRRTVAVDQDAEEDTVTKNVDITSSDLEMTRDIVLNKDQVIGLVFTGAAIPKGVHIDSAWIQFTCKETGTGATTVQIAGEAQDNAALFVEGTATHSISSRLKTAARNSWTIPGWSTTDAAGLSQRSPDLKSIVQEIVNRTGYTSASSLGFIISGTGSRNAYSYNSAQANKAPMLHVEYSIQAPNGVPIARAAAVPLNGKAPLLVNFDGSHSYDPDGEALTYAWNFGDGASSTGVVVSHTYITAGTFPATLTVSDSHGQTGIITVTVTVIPLNSAPVARASATPENGTAPLTISFDGTLSTDADVDALTYAWDFGDGQVGNGVTADHIYTNPGSYSAKLAVNDNHGGADEETVTITVSSPNIAPVAVITVNPQSGISPLTVHFDGILSTDANSDALTYLWNFGDGQTGNGASVDHIYTSPGSYIAKLTINDNHGGMDEETVTITVSSPNIAPVAVITVNPQSGISPLTVHFDGILSTDANSDALTYLWNFGDGQTGNGASVDHIYTSPGSYIAKLTVNDNHGGMAEETVTITVSAPNVAPVAVITVNPQSGISPLSVHFDGILSTDDNSDTLTYSWNFGDGQTENGASVDHIYTSPGSYIAKLTVNDNHGGMAEETVTITVSAPNVAPVAVITVNPQSGISPLSVHFDGILSTDDNSDTLTYSWNFGDGQTGSSASADHIYTSPGSYIAKLTVNDNHGGTDEDTMTITVSAPNVAPVAVITVNSQSGMSPLTVHFDGILSTDANSDALTYLWNFGDGQTENGASVDHIYTSPGSYIAKLTVNDNHGGMAEETVTITVSAPNVAPVAVITVNPQSGISPLTVHFDASLSKDTNNDPLTYLWNFGDGHTGSGVSIEHNYSTDSIYPATLEVNDGHGGTDTKTVMITVSAPPNFAPIAAITANPINGDSPLTVHFDASLSKDTNNDTLKYSWDFGDGQTGSVAINEHIYSSPGIFNVKLTVDDQKGGTDSETVTITVSAPNSTPVAMTSASVQRGKIPLIVSFDGSKSTDNDGDSLLYNWKFGDGDSASGVNVSHIYTTVGTYTATIKVTDRRGATGIASTIVTAVPKTPPTCSIRFSDDITRILESETLAVSVEGNDPDGKVARVVFSFDNEVKMLIKQPPYSYSFTQYTMGQHAIKITVVDDDSLVTDSVFSVTFEKSTRVLPRKTGSVTSEIILSELKDESKNIPRTDSSHVQVERDRTASSHANHSLLSMNQMHYGSSVEPFHPNIVASEIQGNTIQSDVLESTVNNKPSITIVSDRCSSKRLPRKDALRISGELSRQTVSANKILTNSTTVNNVCLTFRNLHIKAGAIIHDAWLEWTYTPPVSCNTITLSVDSKNTESALVVAAYHAKRTGTQTLLTSEWKIPDEAQLQDKHIRRSSLDVKNILQDIISNEDYRSSDMIKLVLSEYGATMKSAGVILKKPSMVMHVEYSTGDGDLTWKSIDDRKVARK